MNEKNIWAEKQNKPTLIVRDILKITTDISKNQIYEILLRRGVFKWFSVRRELIRLKMSWKKEISALNHRKSDYEKGYAKAMDKCRGEVRALCHSERWVAPDNDEKAIEYLREKR